MKDTAIIIQVDYLSQAVEEAQLMAELRNAAKRHDERMAKYREWVEPEAIKERQERHDQEAAAALAKAEELKALLGILPDPPLPDPIPKHMQGQSASTIRAMLRQERWKYDRTLGKWVER